MTIAASVNTKIHEANDFEEKNRFDRLTRRTIDQLAARLRIYEYGLRGVRGAVITAGSEAITWKQFHRYSLSRNIAKEFPGSKGYGFIRRVAPEQESVFLQAARAENRPDFTIQQLIAHDGERFVIQYIEPEADNWKTIGLDIASESNRRSAALDAARSDAATLTQPINFVQTHSKKANGFLLLLPIYQIGTQPISLEERQLLVTGWAYTPLAIEEVMADFDLGGGELTLALYDADTKESEPFYASSGHEQSVTNGLIAQTSFSIYGRNWRVEMKATPFFIKHLNLLPSRYIAGLIVAAGLLFSGLLHIYLLSRQRKQQAILEQAHWAAVVESSSDAIVGESLEGVVTSWNKAAEQIFGYSTREAIGRRLVDLIMPPNLAEEETQILAHIARGERMPHFTAVRRRRDGSLIDVSVAVSPIFAADGQIVGGAKVVRDITEQTLSEERFRLAVEASPNAMLMVNQHRVITLVNRKTEQLFGYARTELIGEVFDCLVPVPHRAAHIGHVEGYFAAPSVRTMGTGQKLFGLRKDGTEVLVEIGLNPIETSNGCFTLASIVDVTERKQLESQLKQALERMKMAVDAADLGVWVWRLSDGQIIWDERMFSFYGAPSEFKENSIDYGYWRSRIHPDDIANVEEKFWRHVRGEGIYDPIFRVVDDAGKVRFIQAKAILEHDADGRPSQMVGINRDITEQKVAEERILELNATLEAQVEQRTIELHRALGVAEQASRAKSDFLANMSHEIRTPMNAILGLAYLLEKQSLAPVTRGMVKKIHIAGQNLLAIINDILDFSKIEAQRLEIEQTPFRLSDVLDSLASIMSAAVGEKCVEVVVGPAPSDGEFLKGDPLRLSQILINLASNAIKFTEQGEVVISIAQVGVAQAENRILLRFSVRDTGIGIPKDKQESIFSAFMQADMSVTRSFGGTGLGLSISRRLVELMGGQLRVSSEPGEGSEFVFELPFEKTNPADSAVPQMMHQRILIADDHAVARALLAETASSLGWSVDAVESGEQAIDLVQAADKANKDYDVLLLDWRMPRMDGLAVAAAIRANCTDPTAPIIIMVTAHDRTVLQGQPGSAIADVVLTKPVTSSCLYNAVIEAKKRRGELDYENIERPVCQRLIGLKVLVVDDSEINREVAYQILSAEGAEVELAADGRAALTALSSRPEFFDAVLMDVQMPILDGYAATRQIRALPEFAHLPVIALTAGAFNTQRQAALEAGMNDFIAKPFDVDALVATLQRCKQPVEADFSTSESIEQPVGAMLEGVDSADRLIDVEHGLRVWRKSAAYDKALRIFSNSHADDGLLIQTALKKGDQEQARALAHKLRGVTGSLALMQVAELAGAVEQALCEGNDARPFVRRLLQAMEQTVAAIHDYLGAGTEPNPLSSSESVEIIANLDLKECFEQLLKALDRDDPGCVEPLLPNLSGFLPQSQIQKLQNYIDAFDFRNAETLVREWMLGATELRSQHEYYSEQQN